MHILISKGGVHMFNDDNAKPQNKSNDDNFIVPLAPTGPFEPMPVSPILIPKPDKDEPRNE